MPLFQLSIIPAGQARSTYHNRHEAATAEDAVRNYINSDPAHSTGAKVAQTLGGIVLVAAAGDSPYGSMPSHGVRLFRVEPTQPIPVERARIAEMVRA